MKNLTSKVTFLIVAYPLIVVIDVLFFINNRFEIHMLLRVLLNLLLIGWLVKNVNKKDLSKAYLFIVSLIVFAIGGQFFLKNDNNTYLIAGTFFFLISRVLYFIYFQKFCSIRNLSTKKLILVLLPNLFSLIFCSKFLISFIPDQIVIFSIIIIFVDSLLLGLSFFYNEKGNLKSWFIFGLICVYFGDLFVGQNLFYGNLIGGKVLGMVLNQISKLILTLVVYFQIKSKKEGLLN